MLFSLLLLSSAGPLAAETGEQDAAEPDGSPIDVGGKPPVVDTTGDLPFGTPQDFLSRIPAGRRYDGRGDGWAPRHEDAAAPGAGRTNERPTPFGAVAMRLTMDTDVEVGAAELVCGSLDEMRPMGTGAATFLARPGLCTVTIVGASVLAAQVWVAWPGGGGRAALPVHCVLRDGGLACR